MNKGLAPVRASFQHHGIPADRRKPSGDYQDSSYYYSDEKLLEHGELVAGEEREYILGAGDSLWIGAYANPECGHRGAALRVFIRVEPGEPGYPGEPEVVWTCGRDPQ